LFESTEVSDAFKSHVNAGPPQMTSIQLPAQLRGLGTGGDHHGMIAEIADAFSDDAAADLAKAKAAGATILKEAMEIPDTGTMAIVRDPRGAVFTLWKCAMKSA